LTGREPDAVTFTNKEHRKKRRRKRRTRQVLEKSSDKQEEGKIKTVYTSSAAINGKRLNSKRKKPYGN